MPSRSTRRRPELRLEMGELGPVDPFTLRVAAHPTGAEEYFVASPEGGGGRIPVERAGLNAIGAGHALIDLSLSWMIAAGRATEDEPEPVASEVRLLIRRREARLLRALLRRHLARLPEPPLWMRELTATLDQMELFLRWGVDS